jgi:hypothetical protein
MCINSRDIHRLGFQGLAADSHWRRGRADGQSSAAQRNAKTLRMARCGDAPKSLGLLSQQ